MHSFFSSSLFSFLFFCLVDVPVQEIYEKMVVRDVYQLEHGVKFNGKHYVGSIHVIIADHAELVAIAGLTSM